MTTQALPQAANARRLTEALRRCGALSRGSVADVAIETSFATVLSHIFRLRLTYDGAAGDPPRSLVLKAGLLDRPGGPWKAGRREVAFYTEVASAMPKRLVPRCFDADWDPGTGAWHLLLEDLTESHQLATRWHCPRTPCSARASSGCGHGFQAAWWDDPRLGETVGTWDDQATMEGSIQRLAGQFARFADQLGDRLSSPRRQLYARLFDSAPRLAAR